MIGADVSDLTAQATGGLVGVVLLCAGWLLNRYRKALLGGEALADGRVAAVRQDGEERVAQLRADFDQWRREQAWRDADHDRQLAAAREQLKECEVRCDSRDAMIVTLERKVAELERQVHELRDVS